MRRPLRVTVYVLTALLAVAAIILGVLFVLTRTEYGVERVRRFAVNRFEEQIEGSLRIERVTTVDLLGRARLHGVAIDDPAGRPFLRADSVFLRYDWRDLAAGRFVFEVIEAHDPTVYVTRLPGDTAWNFEYIFPDTIEDEEPDDLILFEGARVSSGHAEVRFPWEPDGPVEPEDTARLILEPAPGGIVRVLRFEDVDAALSRVLWSSPVEDGSLYEIASLATRGYIWEDPFDLRDLEGTVTVRDSLVSFDVQRFSLPASRASGVGRVITEDDEAQWDVRIEGHDVALADLQWLHPPLPEEGGGSLVFRMRTLAPERTLWLATDAYLRTAGTEVAGDFGIVTGDTLYFTRVDLRASPLDVDLIQQIVPADLPVEGLMIGTVEVEGPLSALRTRGDLRLTAEAGAAEPRGAVRWEGTVDVRDGVVPRRLHAEVGTLDAALVRAFRPEFRLGGRLSGAFDLSTGEDGALGFAAEVRHRADNGAASGFDARGSYRRAGREIELDLRARPLALAALHEVFPQLRPISGDVEGDVRVRGPLDALQLDARLETPGGPFAVEGTLDGVAGALAYRFDGRFDGFEPDRWFAGLPSTRASGRFSIEGEGNPGADGSAGLRLVLEEARVGPVAVHESALALSVADGLLRVDSLGLRTEAGRLSAHGEFGLLEGRNGRIEAELVSRSLEPLRPFFFPDTLIPQADERDRPLVAGALELHGSLEGGIAGFDAHAEAALRDAVYDDARADRIGLQLDARGVGTPERSLRFDGDVRGFAAAGRTVDTATVEASHGPEGGELRVDAHAPGERVYRLSGRLERFPDHSVFHLSDLALRSRDGGWTLSAPAAIRFGSDGAIVDTLELRRDGGGDAAGVIRMAGRLPWTGEAEPARALGGRPVDLDVTADGVRIGELLRLAQARPVADGRLTGRLRVRGTADAPRIESELEMSGLLLDTVTVSRLTATGIYADRVVNATVSAWDGDRRMLTGEGRIPLDLSLTTVDERRLAQPLDVSVQAERVPAAVAAPLVPGIDRVEGEFDGRIAIRGTTRDPAFGGALTLRDAAATWVPSGVRYDGVEGTFRVLGERVVAVDARARAGTGQGMVTGSVTFQPLYDPEFDLTFRLRNFLAARRRDVNLTMTGDARLSGRYTRPAVRGAVRVDRGALYLDELTRQIRIVELSDPLLFDVVDTALVAMRRGFPTARNVFLENLVVDGTVDVSRDFWLRGRDINVELTGELDVTFDRRAEDMRLTGVLNAVRGSYQLRLYNVYARRFTVRDGTVEFVGTPGMNPNLNITAGYRARTRQGDPLDILAHVTGTLRNPRVRLSSEAEPPMSESDLASYLIFGRPTYALAASESRALGQAGGLASLGFQALAPTVLGDVASGLESALGLDYVAISSTQPTGRDGTQAPGTDPFGFLSRFGAEVEIGYYLRPDLFLSGTQRFVGGRAAPQCGEPGFRLEWRFRPTWLTELFWECRFSRYPTFGPEGTLETRATIGFFFAREWGY